MKEFADRAIDLAAVRGASYSDVRIVDRCNQTIVVKNGKVEALSQAESQGFGVRLVVNGAWGFASSSRISPSEIDRITAHAIEIAKASSLVKERNVNLGDSISIVDRYQTPLQIDPFAISLEQKIDALLQADAAMRRVKGVTVAEASFEAQRDDVTFVSSEGSHIEQRLTETGGGIETVAVGFDDVQKRSFPNSFGRHQGKAGYEFFEAMRLADNGQRIAEEAVQLLTAKPCPSGRTTLILDATQLALQVHESCGHPTELDRALGTEAAYAGTSFLMPAMLGQFRYGSDLVNITADATLPGGLGTFGYDDEGVPAQRTPLIADGIFVGYLTSRETASSLGQPSNGAARADGWNRIPLVRMTNVSLEPGTWKFDDLIADTDDGIIMQTNKSWSIDDKRLNFQFGTEIAWEIKNGKLGDMVKNATYAGITYEFWRALDAICDAGHWHVWGTSNCGKGQPGQVAHVGHGAAPARFRNVRVGLIK